MDYGLPNRKLLHIYIHPPLVLHTSFLYVFWCVFFHSSQWRSSWLSNVSAALTHSERTSRLPSIRPETDGRAHMTGCHLTFDKAASRHENNTPGSDKSPRCDTEISETPQGVGVLVLS